MAPSSGLLQGDVIHDITRRIEKAVQQIIPIDPMLTLQDNLIVELIDNGMDMQNRTLVSINIIITSPGNFSRAILSF